MKKIAFALAVSAISTCVLGASPVEKEFFKSASAPEFSNQQKQNLKKVEKFKTDEKRTTIRAW